MRHFPASEFARAMLPSGMEGFALIISAYFDDSGTHDGSEVVVWGGVVASTSRLETFERAWGEMLAAPVPGRPPLKKFGVRDCRRGRGEFFGWREGEKDALRYRVREIIQDSGLHAIAYAMPVKLYNSIIRGRCRRAYGEPGSIAFASCADLALQICADTQGIFPLACIFDKGQDNETTRVYVRDAERRAEAQGIPISYGFAAVADTYGLQAADTIATEHYWFTVDSLKTGEPRPEAHFTSLINMVDPKAWTMGEEELQTMRKRYYESRPIRNWLRGLRES